jgi:FtsZ-binding cell division protein ZapB
MPASRLISKSEFLSSLPPWRRWLARLNWHPTLDAQINAIESRRESERLRHETTQLKNESEQLKNETEQLKNETAQLKIENRRLAALESKLDSLLLSADSSSPIPPATDCN